jgi:hypothetical protein
VSSSRRSTEKQPYEAPAVTDLGSVIELTRGAGGPHLSDNTVTSL